MRIILSLCLICISLNVYAESESYIQLEGSLVYQTRNDQRIPGNGGTKFDLSDFDKGPFEAFRSV